MDLNKRESLDMAPTIFQWFPAQFGYHGRKHCWSFLNLCRQIWPHCAVQLPTCFCGLVYMGPTPRRSIPISGRTKALYAVSFTFWGQLYRFLRRSPRDLVCFGCSVVYMVCPIQFTVGVQRQDRCDLLQSLNDPHS